MSKLGIKVKWKDLDEAFAAFEEEVTEVARGVTVLLWDSILIKTPQYYGGMAASWTYTYAAGNARDRSDMVRPVELAANNMWKSDVYEVRRRGHPVAIGIARAASAGKEKEFKLGRTVYLTNGVDHGEGRYASIVEDWDLMKLRAVNRPGHPMKRSLDLIERRFGKDISTREAEQLRALSITSGAASADSDS